MLNALWRKVTLNTKLISMFILVAVLPFTIGSWIELKSTKEALSNEVKHKLQAVLQIKKNQLEDFISTNLKNIKHFSQKESVSTGIMAFDYAINSSGIDGNVYIEAEKLIGLQLQPFKINYGFNDLFLINKEGTVVYSINKSDELATNLSSEKLSKTKLAEAFHRSKEEVIITDFSIHPTSGQMVAYIAAPVIHPEMGYVGNITLQMLQGQLQKFLSERTGLGDTGETYLVGQNKLLRTDSRRDMKNYSAVASMSNGKKINTTAVNRALTNHTGVETGKNYLGTEVLTAYMPVKIGNMRWGLIGEIDTSEAFHAIDKIEKLIFFIAMTAFIIIIAIAVITSRSISTPVQDAVNQLLNVSQQLFDLSNTVSDSSSTLASGASTQAASLEETASAMEQMTAQSIQNADNATLSKEAVKDITTLLKNSSGNISIVSSLAGDARNSVNKGSEAMNKIAGSMKNILEDSSKITEIIEVLNDITHQTKMLATNAAIEAARAGEHGKGFAVVADEVSKLAESSKSSAKEITDLIKISVHNSEVGTKLAEQGESALTDILDKSVKLADLIDEVSVSSKEQEEKMEQVNTMLGGIKIASDEQAKGVEQSSLALNQIDTITQTNSTTAEYSKNASDNLTKQARLQFEIVDQLTKLIKGSGNKSTLDIQIESNKLKNTSKNKENKDPNTTDLSNHQNKNNDNSFKYQEDEPILVNSLRG